MEINGEFVQTIQNKKKQEDKLSARCYIVITVNEVFHLSMQRGRKDLYQRNRISVDYVEKIEILFLYKIFQGNLVQSYNKKMEKEQKV